MNIERQHTFVDRVDVAGRPWPRGPWDGEPDKVQWTDETGLACLAVRNRMGSWCGYVGVEEGHPLFGMEYSDCPQQCGEDWCKHRPDALLHIHGGVTYTDFCQEESDNGVCHVPMPGRAHRVWWIGFDTCHCNDVQPALPSFNAIFKGHSTYKDLGYVEGQCASLAAQLREMT